MGMFDFTPNDSAEMNTGCFARAPENCSAAGFTRHNMDPLTIDRQDALVRTEKGGRLISSPDCVLLVPGACLDVGERMHHLFAA